KRERQQEKITGAAQRSSHALDRRQTFPLRTIHQERQRDTCEEQENSRRHAAQELRQHVGAAAALICPQKGIEHMALEHDDRAEAADPIEVLKPICAGLGLLHPGVYSFWVLSRGTSDGALSFIAESEMSGLIITLVYVASE